MTYPLQLKLSTMTHLNTIIASQSVCVLQVWSLYQGICLQLPKAYAYDFIPLNVSCILTKYSVLQWPHLKHLANKMAMLQDCDVGPLP